MNNAEALESLKHRDYDISSRIKRQLSLSGGYMTASRAIRRLPQVLREPLESLTFRALIKKLDSLNIVVYQVRIEGEIIAKIHHSGPGFFDSV